MHRRLCLLIDPHLFHSRVLLPSGDSADMTYYNRHPKEKILPPLGGFLQQWSNAAKGDLKTSCDFVYGSNAIEQMCVGLVAYRLGEKLEYDGATGRISGGGEGDTLYKRKYRQGWPLDG